MIYHDRITSTTLSAQAFATIRRKIIRLELAPGDVVREDVLCAEIDIGRTPVREALQRLARDQFVTVIARRGMFVSSIEAGDLAMLFETRAVLEPYAARLACERGGDVQWARMRAAITAADGARDDDELLDIDRRCHEIIWAAASNRFLTDTLDTLYAHSHRVWHLYLADVADTRRAVTEHADIVTALEARDVDGAARLVEAHVRSFDAQVRDAGPFPAPPKSVG